MITIEPFLTAYDPSEVPGSSIDPLGFDRGYTTLADAILPGLTNVASRPRYFAMLCAALQLADSAPPTGTPRDRLRHRRELVLRAERLWTLACTLASRGDDSGRMPTDGLRGIRALDRLVARLSASGEKTVSANFRLLSRQDAMGMLGIFGTVADNLGLIARSELSLGSDLGHRLATTFLNDTRPATGVRRAIVEGGIARVDELRDWGQRAHVNAVVSRAEHAILREAIDADDVRSRMAAWALRVPGTEGETELLRFQRMLASGPGDPDLVEALRIIGAFEQCFRLTSLAFQRLLWLCQSRSPARVDVDELANDPTLIAVVAALPAAVLALTAALDAVTTSSVRARVSRLTDTYTFLIIAARAPSSLGLVECLLQRHTHVQGTRRQGGRAKMPWLELRDGRLSQTLTWATRVTREPNSIEHVAAHPYRMAALDRIVFGGEGES